MRRLPLILCLLPGLAAAAPDGPRLSVTAHDESGALVQATLHGGHLDSAGALRGARMRLTWPDGRAWDAFDPSLHPWTLAAGTFAGGPVLLVGVRKPTLFDPVERERPFIYTLRPAGQGLRKRWLGTSLSRPFHAACFADLQPGGDDELCALERTRAGGWELAAYVWEGFGVEGLASSPPLPPADTQPALAALDSPEGHHPIVMTRHGARATFTAFALREAALADAPCLAPVARRTVTVGAAPFTWSPYSSPALPLGVTLTRGKALRVMPLHSLSEGPLPAPCE